MGAVGYNNFCRADANVLTEVQPIRREKKEIEVRTGRIVEYARAILSFAGERSSAQRNVSTITAQ